jgi:hypothetical protein
VQTGEHHELTLYECQIENSGDIYGVWVLFYCHPKGITTLQNSTSSGMFKMFSHSWKVTDAISVLAFLHVCRTLPYCLLNIFSLLKLFPLERFLHLHEEVEVSRAYFVPFSDCYCTTETD